VQKAYSVFDEFKKFAFKGKGKELLTEIHELLKAGRA
jgi:hypothetical protein